MEAPFISASLLVHVASLLYVVAFVVRNQLVLRTLVLIATVLYIAYYFFAPDVPLWDAIGWSAVLGLANIYVMSKLMLERTTFRLTNAQRQLYDVFHTLNPGEFRQLLKITHWHSVEAATVQTLTTEGKACTDLFLVLSGQISIDKGARSFAVEPEKFIGEVSYYLQKPASATVTVTGGTYVSWSHSALETLKRKNPAIRIAVQQILSTDMAHKIAVS